MPGLVECVPNVSEGRRRDVIDRLAEAIRGVAGVRLLDQTSDVDHNRSVFTFAGDADAVARAAHALVDATFREVDLRTHTGEHPRLGAVDVIPFVPLAGVTMDDCIALAHRVGREIAERHQVPVYFYAKAALRPERVRLPDIRKPQYEGLAELLATSHVPDAGPAQLHLTAGAVVVGARPPLIAFNIELDTTDLKLAQRIAKEIRESSGGLPAGQGKGLMVSDPPRAQVSINLLDHPTTSLITGWRGVGKGGDAPGGER